MGRSSHTLLHDEAHWGDTLCCADLRSACDKTPHHSFMSDLFHLLSCVAVYVRACISWLFVMMAFTQVHLLAW